MLNHKQKANLLGIFYILAAVTSVIAVILYEPVMSQDFHLVVANGQKTTVLWGVVMDVILLVSAMGTTTFLAPYLRRVDSQLALGYYSTRFMEAVFIGIGLASMLVLLSLSEAFASGLVTDSQALLAQGYAWQGMHRWIMVLGPNFMLGINTFLYSLLFVRSQLIPKKLAYFGIITAVMVFIAGFLDMFGIIEPWSTAKGLIALPVGVYEISLAIYLIVKGFRDEGLALHDEAETIR